MKQHVNDVRINHEKEYCCQDNNMIKQGCVLFDHSTAVHWQVRCRCNSRSCGRAGCPGGNSLKETNRQETEEQLREGRSDIWSSLKKNKQRRKTVVSGFRLKTMESPAASGGDVGLQDVLRGRTDGAQRMKSSSNMIRVFISSTFTGQSRFTHWLWSLHDGQIHDQFLCMWEVCVAWVCKSQENKYECLEKICREKEKWYLSIIFSVEFIFAPLL